MRISLQDSQFHAQLWKGFTRCTFHTHISQDHLLALELPFLELINDWALASSSPLYTTDKYLLYLDLFVCPVGSCCGLQGCGKTQQQSVASEIKDVF